MLLRFTHTSTALAWLLVGLASCLESSDFAGGGRTIELPGRDAGALTVTAIEDDSSSPPADSGLDDQEAGDGR